MHLLVGLRSSWKCVEVSLQDGSVPVIGGMVLQDCNIEPAIWFKVLVLDTVCIDCSDHVISWAVPSPTSHPSSTSEHTLMAPHEEGESSCPDNLHNLFEVAETLFRVSPLCCPFDTTTAHPPGKSSLLSSHEETEQQLWLRLLHTLLLPLLTLQREDLPSLKQSLEHYCTHTMASMDSGIAQSTALSQELKAKLDSVRSSLLPLVSSSPSHPHPHQLLSCLLSDIKKSEDETRSKIACCDRSMVLNSRLASSGYPGLSLAQLQRDKELAQNNLAETAATRTALESLISQDKSERSCACDDASQLRAGSDGLASLTGEYLALHERLSEARATANHWSSKKVLALSVREAMEQTVASLRAGHVTAGMDIGIHGGHSTDVLPEASEYRARDEYTTLDEKVKQLLELNSRAGRLHSSLVKAVQMDWFPSMCNGFIIVSPDMMSKLPSPKTRSLSWRRHFSLSGKKQTPNSPASPIPSSMSQAGKLLHRRFHEIVCAVCDQLADHSPSFHQQVWLCYETLFFDSFSSSFLSHYKSENEKFCEQLRLNALSVSVLSPSSLALHLPESSWLHLFSPRPFDSATHLYTHTSEVDITSQPPQLPSDIQDKFGAVVTDLYCMAQSRAPLVKLQLLTSAFRKTMAVLSSLKLENLLEEGCTDFQMAGVSCDDLLPLLVLLLLQLPPTFLSHLWLHCLLLEDCCPAFLQAGWHGYSLTTFRSSLKIISEL